MNDNSSSYESQSGVGGDGSRRIEQSVMFNRQFEIRKKTSSPQIYTTWPFSAEEAKRRQEETAAEMGLPIEFENSIGMKFKLIPAGEFMMGSPEDEDLRFTDEGPVHEVRITTPFYMGVYPVTQAQYEQIMGKNPSSFRGADLPVEQINWREVQSFIEKLSDILQEKTFSQSLQYLIPSEAQVEYACRAGTKEPRYGDLEAIAWYHGNSGQQTHPVGQKEPNAFCLFDMIGNVWECCSDWLSEKYSETSPSDDPTRLSKGESRVLRGGSWHSFPGDCRSARRLGSAPGDRYHGLGFRLICSVE